MQYIDSHCHLTCDELWPQADELIERAEDFAGFLVISTNRKEFERALELKERHPDRVRLAFGYYPGDARDITEEDMAYLEKCLEEGLLDVLGEIGLDYHWDDSFRDIQKDLFIRQLKLAEKHGLPVSIHMRDATGDTMEILKEHGKTPIIFHCYSGSRETVDEILKLDSLISFAGPITFKNNRKARDIVRAVPAERILFETDAPYLTPVPFRGKRNEPSYARYTLEKGAEFREEDPEQLAAQVLANYQALFD